MGARGGAFKFTLNVATPPQLAPNKAMKDWIKATQAPIVLGNDPEAAVRGADCVVTDTWVSMGDKEGEHRHNVLKPYQVNAKLMSLANKDAIFMHCLPAHRGEEVTAEVIDGPQSVVFDEAENRPERHPGVVLRRWGSGAHATLKFDRWRTDTNHGCPPRTRGPIPRDLSFRDMATSFRMTPRLWVPARSRDDREISPPFARFRFPPTPDKAP
jgi:hypothetical protein